MSFHVAHHLLPSRDSRDALPCVRPTKDDRFFHTD